MTLPSLHDPLIFFSMFSNNQIEGRFKIKNDGEVGSFWGNSSGDTDDATVLAYDSTSLVSHKMTSDDEEEWLTRASDALDSLFQGIKSVSIDVPLDSVQTYGAENITYTPGRYDAGEQIIFNGTVITFDGLGDPNAKFYITARNTIDFNAGTHMLLKNGAQSTNIFWLTVLNDITITLSLIHI